MTGIRQRLRTALSPRGALTAHGHPPSTNRHNQETNRQHLPGPAIRLTDARVVYGRTSQAVHGVSLEVPEGSIVALIGGNGAGKTTILRTISGLNAFHGAVLVDGHVDIFGKDVTGARPITLVRSGVTQVMENRRIFPELTVEENLRVGGYPRRRAKAALEASTTRVMDLFPQLASRRSTRAGYLSGGEQQMLAIGRALMAAPRIMLLDEPSLGLAPRIVEVIAEAITAINREGMSVLLVEQNAALALHLAHQVYVLQNGTVVESGLSTELASVTEAYLGNSSSPAAAPDRLPKGSS